MNSNLPAALVAVVVFLLAAMFHMHVLTLLAGKAEVLVDNSRPKADV